MKSIINIFLSALFLTGLFSCGNDFLDNSPSTSLGDNEVVESLTDLDNAANGCYNYLKATSGAYDYYYTSYYMFSGDVMGDDFRTERDWMRDYYEYNSTPADVTTVIYRNVYSMCNHICVVLKAAQDLEESAPKDELLAELHVLRALGHWDIARLYSPLPSNLGKGTISADALGIRILDQVEDDIRRPSYRDKAKDVYSFIRTELETWVPKLTRTKQKGRLDYWAGKAFLARFYLFNEDWKGALDAAEEIINSGKFQLYEKDEYVSSWLQEFTKESIFELKTSDTEPNQWVSLGTLVGGTRYHQVGTTKDFEALMAADPEDVRFDLYVYSSPEQYYVARWKYEGRNGNEKVCNPKIFRLSEMYLIAAEAALKFNGDTKKAGKYLSDLREKRTATLPRKYDHSVSMDDILYERRVELACEGHRAWDLWRLGKTVVRWTTPEEKLEKRHLDNLGVIPFDHFRRIWPIPEREIQLLPAGDRAAQQTPGY